MFDCNYSCAWSPLQESDGGGGRGVGFDRGWAEMRDDGRGGV